MLCLKKRRTYSFTQGVCAELPRRSKKDNHRYEGSLDMAVTTLPRKNRNREERPSRMVLTVTEDTPADMLAGSMELLVQLPREHHQQTQRVTVQRSTPMMDLLVQIATAHKLAASSYTLQAIGERGMVLPHQPNTPIGALDALQVKLLPKQGTFVPRKTKQANQPFETTFRLQVHLPRNQLYVSRVSPRMNLAEILDEVCREKNLDRSKYELRHPANLETLDLSLSLQDYHLQEVTLYAKQGRTLGSALSTQDIMALHRQEERRRQQAKQSVFGFAFKKSKECSLSTDSLGGRSASPARSDETGRSTSPLQPPARPQRKRRPAPKPPVPAQPEGAEENAADSCKDKVVISHSRNSSDSSGYHEASVLSDNPDSAGRLPETLPRRSKFPSETPRKLAHTSQSSKSLSNLASVPGTLSRGISSTSLSSTGLRKKRNAPLPPVTRPLSSAISTQALERIVDSEESLTSDMDPSKPPSDIGAPSKANSDIEERPKASSDIGVTTVGAKIDFANTGSSTVCVEAKAGKMDVESRHRSGSVNVKLPPSNEGHTVPVEEAPVDVRVPSKRVGEPVPLPKPRKTSTSGNTSVRPQVPKRKLAPPSPLSRALPSNSGNVDHFAKGPPPPAHSASKSIASDASSNVLPGTPAVGDGTSSAVSDRKLEEDQDKPDVASTCSTSEDEVFLTPGIEHSQASFDYDSLPLEEKDRPIKVVSANSELAIVPATQRRQSSPIAETVAGQEKKLCAVISTMPKCEHLAELAESNGNLFFKKKHAESRGNNTDRANDRHRSGEGAKESRRPRIPRTASKSNDFETNSLEKQKRHFTSHSEDITFALNLNVASNVGLLSARSDQFGGNVTQEPRTERNTADIHRCFVQGEGEGESSCGSGTSDCNPSETDVLLQKVSDTLSNSLPASTLSQVPVERFVSLVEAKSRTTNAEKTLNEEEDSKQRQSNDFPDGAIAKTSTPNLTVNSQQDTSDYVSAADEDLSIADWEYQLPAPPSAFRDSTSPVFNDFNEVISSPESFRDSELKEHAKPSDDREQKAKREAADKKSVFREEDKKNSKQDRFHLQSKSDSNLKKVMISELETKIGTFPQSTVDFESKKVADNSSAPKIAPIDNTLSNFTITTYTRQKSRNIFEEVEKQSQGKTTDDRFVKSFVTLSRNRSNLVDGDDRAAKESNVGGTSQVKTKVDDTGDRKLEPKIHTESLHRQSGNEKTNIHRSKSYVSVCDKSKFQETTRDDEHAGKNRNAAAMDDAGMKKATSISNLNATRSIEKFSQWRDNILKRQEEPTKEKQLQSLQVLKSILPQLKNAQQSEENVPKESDDTVLPEKTRPETTSKEHSIDSNVVSTCTDKKPEADTKKIPPATTAKRYTYSGPPAISLGSWSERPSVNVHIKRDTDYKLDARKVNGNKTVVNINGIRDETSGSIDFNNKTKPHKAPQKGNQIEITERREPNELAKKLITHTTATGFKRPVLNKVRIESKPASDKPVVTGVELKKSLPETKPPPADTAIDTTPLNFRELSKAFGQDVCLRPKPKRSTLNRASDVQIEITSNKQNERVDSEGSNNAVGEQRLSNAGNRDTSKPNRFATVVGAQPQNQGTFPFRNGIIGTKGGQQPVPTVKSFKISTANEEHCNQNNTKEHKKEPSVIPQPPRPPTMPVITGVTLKTARPKSMPVQVDTRDMLLESIRNFGGRENLKSAAERC
ncbi:uncharacterized protein LOC116430769 isoform X2 [Nomia melanderi]|uniref:uncharacterized protein LOC116430769 isoform X2 n=1 Tax=Nomia melanderi TaxID=2448451 RepID=UPI003FCE0EE3